MNKRFGHDLVVQIGIERTRMCDERMAVVQGSVSQRWTVALVLCGVVAAAGLSRADDRFDPEPVAGLLELVIDADPQTAAECLRVLSAKVQSGELGRDEVARLRSRLSATVGKLSAGGKQPLRWPALVLAASWGDPAALQDMRRVLGDRQQPPERRVEALDALLAARDRSLLDAAASLFREPGPSGTAMCRALLERLARLNDPQIADVVLRSYADLEPELQPRAIELLTQRTAWSRRLLEAIRAGRVGASALNANQARRMLLSGDAELQRLVEETWGTVRTERDPQREQVIQQVRAMLAQMRGDPAAGRAVFHRVCAQCHTIYGQGSQVGPDLTGNGRGSFDQLLSNVLDPSLVIGADYQARTVITTDGRVVTGILEENSDTRVVLKVQGGKREVVPREEVEEVVVSQLSLMPEGIEKQLTPQELVDLLAFLCLDRPPEDAAARTIPGTPDFFHNRQ